MDNYYENMYGPDVNFDNLKNIKRLAPLKRVKKELVKKWCKGFRILEIGCGLGEYISMFKAEIYGSDISFNALVKAKEFCANDNFFQANAEVLPLKSESFDCIILPDIIEHVDNDNNLIDEVFRVVRKNGRIILITPYSYKFESKNCNVRLWNRIGEGGDLRKYGLELVDRFLNKGFKDVKIGFIGGPLVKFFDKIKMKILKRKGYDRNDILSGKISEVKGVGLYSRILYLIYKLDFFIFGRFRGHYLFLVLDKK